MVFIRGFFWSWNWHYGLQMDLTHKAYLPKLRSMMTQHFSLYADSALFPPCWLSTFLSLMSQHFSLNDESALFPLSWLSTFPSLISQQFSLHADSALFPLWRLSIFLFSSYILQPTFAIFLSPLWAEEVYRATTRMWDVVVSCFHRPWLRSCDRTVFVDTHRSSGTSFCSSLTQAALYLK